MEHKNIDRLFQEQLKNLEATPNKKVWNNIEAKLTKKKKKIIPFWWFSGGIAAALVIGLLLFPVSKNNTEIDLNTIKNIVTITPENKLEIKNNSKKHIDTILKNKKNNQQILIANKEKRTKNQNKNQKGKQLIVGNKTRIAKNRNPKSEIKKKLVSEKDAIKKIFLANNSSEIKIETKQKETFHKKIQKKVSKKQDLLEEAEFFDKKTTSKETKLKKFISKKDSLKIKKTLHKKWTVAPTFAVLSSNSFSNTSPIDKNLTNSTEGKNSFSYGVQIGYKISKKWTIQSGIHLQETRYGNNEIVVSPSITNSSAVAFERENTFSLKTNTVNIANFDSNSLTNVPNSTGSLAQNYGYLEIPIEIKYNFSNHKKFETQLVAGFSSLFLNKNEITLNTASFSESLEANNLNTINFSGNLGFDFNYLINKNWSLNINPMFKAQLNTFNNNSNGFSPFNIGVYSGIKYSF